jgi:DNA repair exonuclease SbcCD ATPase subunit
MKPLLRTCRWIGTLSLLLACGAGFAADDAATAKREREQLQRTRSALRDTTAQRDALQAEKAAWEQEKQKLTAELARNRGADRNAATLVRNQLQQCEETAKNQAQELAALRASQSQAEEQAAQRDTSARQQLAAAQRQGAESAATVRATGLLLERSTAELARAERSNVQMLAAGLQAVEALRLELVAQQSPMLDPLGLAAVRHENTLVGLREALERARLAKSP